MPSPAGVLAPLLLATVLIVSALAKRRQPESTRSAIMLLRMPRFLQSAWVAKALPVGEGLLALIMVASPLTWLTQLASVVSLVLFVTYFVVIARALTFDPRPNCGCFGNIGDQRVRPKTLWRNGLFVALAGVFVWFAADGHTVPGVLWSMGTTGWAWLLGAVAVGAAVVLIGPGATGTPRPAPQQPPVAQSIPDGHSEPLAALEAEPEDYVREPIPRAVLIDPEGAGHLLHAMAARRAQLLVFVNCYCGPTHAVIRDVVPLRARVPQIDVRVVFAGVDVLPSSPDLPTDDAWRDFGGITWSTFGFTSSPSAVLLGADGLLAGGPVGGYEAVVDFFEEVADALADAPTQGQDDGELIVGEVLETH